MAVKFSQFNLGTASATAYVVGYDGSSNVKIPATELTPSGTPGYLPKYASPSGLANSLISDDGSYVTVGGYLIATNDATINGLVAGRGNGALPDNVAFGISALSSNYSGSASVSIGGYSLSSNFSGNNNVAVGAYAMQLSGQANNNVAIGQSALNGLTGISGNTDNVAIGYQAMRTKTGVLGAGNLAVGTLALADGGGTGGSNNVAIGTQALRTLQSGTRNVAVGYQSQRFNVSGTNNVSLGWQGLYNVTGSQNVGVGYLSGYLITTGSNNVVIGGNSGSSINTLSNFMLFADGAGNERFRIPSTGNVLIGTTTDAGYKLDVNGTFRAQDFRTNLSGGIQYIESTAQMYIASSGNMTFANGGSASFRIQSDKVQTLRRFDWLNSATDPVAGTSGTYYNTTDNALRIYNGTNWQNILAPNSSGNVGIGTTSPNASALLDITSTTKGFLPPRMTNAEITAIASPAAGLVVYSTTALTLAFYNGTGWRKVTDTAL